MLTARHDDFGFVNIYFDLQATGGGDLWYTRILRRSVAAGAQSNLIGVKETDISDGYYNWYHGGYRVNGDVGGYDSSYKINYLRVVSTTLYADTGWIIMKLSDKLSITDGEITDGTEITRFAATGMIF